jgi:hypothetical protein
MKGILISIYILGSFFLFTKCSDKTGLASDYSCTDCNQEVPVNSTLTILLTINDNNKAVPITIYRGYFVLNSSVNKVIDTIATDVKFEIQMPVNSRYTAVATYKKNGKEVKSVDGEEFTTKDVADYCGVTCYKTLGGTLDVKLK